MDVRWGIVYIPTVWLLADQLGTSPRKFKDEWDEVWFLFDTPRKNIKSGVRQRHLLFRSFKLEDYRNDVIQELKKKKFMVLDQMIGIIIMDQDRMKKQAKINSSFFILSTKTSGCKIKKIVKFIITKNIYIHYYILCVWV